LRAFIITHYPDPIGRKTKQQHWLLALGLNSIAFRRPDRKSSSEIVHHCRRVLAGIKIAVVARQLGISRSWASKGADAPTTRLFIAGLLAPHRESLNGLFGPNPGRQRTDCSGVVEGIRRLSIEVLAAGLATSIQSSNLPYLVPIVCCIHNPTTGLGAKTNGFRLRSE
jgi:hypothetical protein